MAQCPRMAKQMKQAPQPINNRATQADPKEQHQRVTCGFCEFHRFLFLQQTSDQREISKELKAGKNCRRCNKRFNPDFPVSCFFQLVEENQTSRPNSPESVHEKLSDQVSTTTPDSEDSWHSEHTSHAIGNSAALHKTRNRMAPITLFLHILTQKAQQTGPCLKIWGISLGTKIPLGGIQRIYGFELDILTNGQRSMLP